MLFDFEEEAGRRKRYYFLEFERYFEYLTTKDKAKKIKVSVAIYNKMKKMYEPYTREEVDDEEFISNIIEYLTRSL